MNPYLPAENVKLVLSGKDYFDVLETLINNCSQTLHLQTYIFETDETGKRVIDCLIKAAQRNVKVFVMADAFGSYPFSKQISAQMLAAGIHFRLFARLFSTESVFFMRRLHHKIAVADGAAALIGGINIANKYNETQDPAWLDYAVFSNGKACEYLQLLCEKFYYRQNSFALNNWLRQQQLQDGIIRYRQNDFLKRKNEIHHGYIESLQNAKTSITIVGSYFLPGKKIRKLLRDAAARGVNITIILSRKSDTTSVRLAETYLYDFYLKNKICIYEWKRSVMHGKAMLVDDGWATIGSYNINYLSHYLSVELNADIKDLLFISEFKQHLNTICEKDCIKVDASAIIKRSWFANLKIRLAYNFHSLLMNVLLAHNKQKK